MSEPLGSRVPASPVPTVETEAFWQAARDGRLMIGHCRACGQHHFYPRPRCPRCLSDETGLIDASGRGTLYSWSVMRRAPIPYAIAYVTLEEGPVMMTNIIGCTPDELIIGMPVELRFVAAQDGQPVPMFAPSRPA